MTLTSKERLPSRIKQASSSQGCNSIPKWWMTLWLVVLRKKRRRRRRWQQITTRSKPLSSRKLSKMKWAQSITKLERKRRRYESGKSRCGCSSINKREISTSSKDSLMKWKRENFIWNKKKNGLDWHRLKKHRELKRRRLLKREVRLSEDRWSNSSSNSNLSSRSKHCNSNSSNKCNLNRWDSNSNKSRARSSLLLNRCNRFSSNYNYRQMLQDTTIFSWHLKWK